MLVVQNREISKSEHSQNVMVELELLMERETSGSTQNH